MSFPQRAPGWILRAVAGLTYLFLFGPLLITAAVSFNEVNQSRFPPVGFSLQWWHEALTAKWLAPLWFSLQLSTGVAIATMLLGLPFAIGLANPKLPGRNALLALSTGPLVLPTMVTGIGLLQLMQFSGARGLLGLPALFIGHVVICLPYCVRTVAISLTTMPPTIERAAASLGAPPIRIFFEITLPIIKTGIFAGGVFAFIQSFTDYSISLFLARAGAQPITVTILSFLEFGFAPTLAAVAVLTLVAPLILIAAVQRFFRIGDFIYGGRGGG